LSRSPSKLDSWADAGDHGFRTAYLDRIHELRVAHDELIAENAELRRAVDVREYRAASPATSEAEGALREAVRLKDAELQRVREVLDLLEREQQSTQQDALRWRTEYDNAVRRIRELEGRLDDRDGSQQEVTSVWRNERATLHERVTEITEMHRDQITKTELAEQRIQETAGELAVARAMVRDVEARASAAAVEKTDLTLKCDELQSQADSYRGQASVLQAELDRLKEARKREEAESAGALSAAATASSETKRRVNALEQSVLEAQAESLASHLRASELSVEISRHQRRIRELEEQLQRHASSETQQMSDAIAARARTDAAEDARRALTKKLSQAQQELEHSKLEKDGLWVQLEELSKSERSVGLDYQRRIDEEIRAREAANEGSIRLQCQIAELQGRICDLEVEVRRVTRQRDALEEQHAAEKREWHEQRVRSVYDMEALQRESQSLRTKLAEVERNIQARDLEIFSVVDQHLTAVGKQAETSASLLSPPLMEGWKSVDSTKAGSWSTNSSRYETQSLIRKDIGGGLGELQESRRSIGSPGVSRTVPETPARVSFGSSRFRTPSAPSHDTAPSLRSSRS